MTQPLPPTPPVGKTGETDAERAERERAEQRRAEEIVAAVPPAPEPHRLPRPNNSYTPRSDSEIAAHLIGVFEQHQRLQVANIEQMSDMWMRAWEQVRATLELMENTARIMQVVIGEAADTQTQLSDAVNRLGVATSAIAQTNLQLQAIVAAARQANGV